MGPIFEANEKVKEELVTRFHVSKAKTVLHKNGSYYLSDPFLETEIYWNSLKDFKNISEEDAAELGDILRQLQTTTQELGGQMTPPMFEYKNKLPVIVWAQFFTNEPEENS
jgi:hypothetical protein